MQIPAVKRVIFLSLFFGLKVSLRSKATFTGKTAHKNKLTIRWERIFGIKGE